MCRVPAGKPRPQTARRPFHAQRARPRPSAAAQVSRTTNGSSSGRTSKGDTRQIPSGRITFYIAIEMPAQIEKYSSTIQSNFRRTSPTITFDESFLPAAGKEFGADDFCEPRLPLTSGPVQDADKQAFKAEKINTDLRPAMSSYGGVTQPPPQIPAGFLFTVPCVAPSLPVS